MNHKGYFYTAITAALILISLLIIFFYSQTTELEIESMQKRISTDSLHYFVENLKVDYQNALEISGNRAITVLIGRILNSSENFAEYEMHQCNFFKYKTKGSQSAISELMLCGTLNGEKVSEMDNITLLNWTQRMSRINDITIENLTIEDISIAMRNSWDIVIASSVYLSARDKANISNFNGILNVAQEISVEGFEDPLYYIKTNDSDLIRKFKKCDNFTTVNGTIINTWISEKCYHSSNDSYNASSFFDRLDGKLNLSEKYATQSKIYFGNYEIGIESFVNLTEFFRHNLSLNFKDNKTYETWIDYLYWQGIEGNCRVNFTINYAINETHNITFSIDQAHAVKYNISDANCL
ncbi:MAG: hypothetical protein QXY62_02680 [Candidatus Altiarchaeota archaeon]